MNQYSFQGSETTLDIETIPGYDEASANLSNIREFTIFVTTDRPRTIILPKSSIFPLKSTDIVILDVSGQCNINNVTVLSNTGDPEDVINGGTSYTMTQAWQGVSFNLFNTNQYFTLNLGSTSGGGGSGTVTNVAVTLTDGITGSVANPNTTANITLGLGNITPTSVATQTYVVNSTDGHTTTITMPTGASANFNLMLPTTAGSSGQVLSTNGSGVLSWINQSSGGGVGGSGTLNYVAKWTPNGATLGNSLMFDDGTSVQIGGTGSLGATIPFQISRSIAANFLESNLINTSTTGTTVLAVRNTTNSAFAFFGINGTTSSFFQESGLPGATFIYANNTVSGALKGQVNILMTFNSNGDTQTINLSGTDELATWATAPYGFQVKGYWAAGPNVVTHNASFFANDPVDNSSRCVIIVGSTNAVAPTTDAAGFIQLYPLAQSGTFGFVIRADNGTQNFFGGKSGINTVTPSQQLSVNGNFSLETAGNKLFIKTGANASMGTATLVGGTITVNTTAVTASSNIFLSIIGNTNISDRAVQITAIISGTSFTISSTFAGDTSTIAWLIVEPF